MASDEEKVRDAADSILKAGDATKLTEKSLRQKIEENTGIDTSSADMKKLVKSIVTDFLSTSKDADDNAAADSGKPNIQSNFQKKRKIQSEAKAGNDGGDFFIEVREIIFLPV